jgi:hypothetical protein
LEEEKRERKGKDRGVWPRRSGCGGGYPWWVSVCVCVRERERERETERAEMRVPVFKRYGIRTKDWVARG